MAQARGRYQQALMDELQPPTDGGQMPPTKSLDALRPYGGVLNTATGPLRDLLGGGAPQDKTFDAVRQHAGVTNTATSPLRGFLNNSQSHQRNMQAGYDVDAWNALSPAQQQPYVQQGGAPGMTAPVPAQKPGVVNGDYQSYVMGLLKDKPYGAQSLAGIEGDLSSQGIQLQKDSGGRVRGRIKLPDGSIVDLPGEGEGNDWWSNPQAGSFKWLNRGKEGLDAGGWSFGGGGGGMSAPAVAPSGGVALGGQLGGDPIARIQQALSQINQGGRVNLDALLSQLQGV